MDRFTVRPAQMADLAALVSLHAAAFSDNWLESGLKALLAGPGVTALLAEKEGTPCGFILLRQAADEAEILTLAVAPPWRRRGLARNLVIRASRRAAGLGARRIFLEVGEENEPARALYGGLGFVQVGRRTDYYGPLAHALILQADLAPGSEVMGISPGPD